MAKNGLVWITTSTFSAAASVSINNCFSATYTHYIIKRNLLGSSSLARLDVRLRAASVDSSTAVYREQVLTAAGVTPSGARTTGITIWQGGLGYAEITSIGSNETWISNPFETVRTTAWRDAGYDHTANILMEYGVFEHDNATSYDGFTVIPSAGTITGSISVFGLVTA